MEDREIRAEEEVKEETKEVEINYQQQIEKIMNFQAITGTSNSDLAAKYLLKNEWDESKAAKDYIDEINKQDFINAQARAHNAMYQEHNMDIEPEAEALIDNNNYYQQEYDNLNGGGKGIFTYLLEYTLYPIGRGVSYLIPSFLK